MKAILTLSVALSALLFSSCETTNVIQPEPSTVTESVRRTSSSSYSTSPAYSTTPAMSTTTETRSVTVE